MAFTLVHADPFTRSDRSDIVGDTLPTGGSTWAKLTGLTGTNNGTEGIASGVAGGTGGGAQQYVVAGVDVHDQRVSITNVGHLAGIVLRGKNGVGCYQINYYDTIKSIYVYFQPPSGSYVEITHYTNVGMNLGESMQAEIIDDGGSPGDGLLTVWKNGTKVIDSFSVVGVLTSGSYGLSIDGGGGVLDDFNGYQQSSGTVPTISYAGSPYSKTQGASIGNVDHTLVSGDAVVSVTVTPDPTLDGLALALSGGNVARFTGTPTGHGTLSYTVTPINATGSGPTATAVFVVAQSAAPTIAYTSPQQVVVGAVFTLTPSTLTGYGKTVTANRVAPDGLALTASTGVTTGTATDAAFLAWTGTRDVVYTVTDANGVTASATVSIEVVYQITIHGANADGSDDTVETIHFGAASGGERGPLQAAPVMACPLDSSPLLECPFA